MLIRLYRRQQGQTNAPEECFYIQTQTAQPLTSEEKARVRWLLTQPETGIQQRPFYPNRDVVEIGPRVAVETPFSSNAVAICQAIGLSVERFERSVRYPLALGSADELVASHCDIMTQEVYQRPLRSFELKVTPEPVRTVPVLARGEDVLREENVRLGLGMDEQDIEYYVDLFQKKLGRDPTDVELYQLGVANSDHCRHGTFRGLQVIDGNEMPDSLMDIVKRPWEQHPGNRLVAFRDNAGIIRGNEVRVLVPKLPGFISVLGERTVTLHVAATGETHNSPTGTAPSPGAETGAGGRIRDSRAPGRGGWWHAGSAGYCVGNAHIPDFAIAGEVIGGEVTPGLASALSILIEGSNGVTDYGNKIGEPLIGGFVRSFEQMVGNTRYGWRKPILFTGGLGRVDDRHLTKQEPEPGMHIVRFGGPAYRIGVGGGSASSMEHGTNKTNLDLQAVQRGNAEMENRANRVIQACVELGDENPIASIHDQGAGGPSNVLSELMEPAGGQVDIRKIVLGDRTMSILEIWVAEYQEGYGVLVRPASLDRFRAICERERVNCEVLGQITGDGNVVVLDSDNNTEAVHLPLTDILTGLPRKRFESRRQPISLSPLTLPNISVGEALEKVLSLPQVGSKGYLVHKGDRSVTGLVVQQQCCGPTQVPVADAMVVADSFFGTTGAAMAIGEQPIKMFINPAAGARMAVAEMLTNLACVVVSDLSDVSVHANWMWAAKQPGQLPRIYDAAQGFAEAMEALGIASTGGKDSLSMSAKVGDETVVAPGQLVITGYAAVPDFRKRVTPDCYRSDAYRGIVKLIDLGQGKNRLGGSSLAQAFGQIGNETPDIDDLDLLRRAFLAVQEMISVGCLRAYHDRSDGGLIVALAEMCIASNCGAVLSLTADADPFAELFNEEAGMLLEFAGPEEARRAGDILRKHHVPVRHGLTISTCAKWGQFTVTQGGVSLCQVPLPELRHQWEAVSLALDRQQANPDTVAQEAEAPYHSLTPIATPNATDGTAYFKTFSSALPVLDENVRRPRVAVIREEGTNGDREMAAAFHHAGFQVADISMNDLLACDDSILDPFQVVAFAGGFSFADVLGSATGWAASIRFNDRLRRIFDRFYARSDTLSLGVCNGCQLMARLGVVPGGVRSEAGQPRFVHNLSGRFESRWSLVRILRGTPSVWVRGMEGSVLGIHVAHAEGRLVFPTKEVMQRVHQKALVPILYEGPTLAGPTEKYPYNPNGSTGGFASLCSEDGRHLALMPHPERCFLPWQWHWMPPPWRSEEAAPWLRLFLNARDWCLEHA